MAACQSITPAVYSASTSEVAEMGAVTRMSSSSSETPSS